MELTPAKFRRGKIDRSAEALRVCHHPFHLSLRKQTLLQHRVSNRAGKTAENGKNQQGQSMM
jgi:hypothetical protein